MSHLTTYKAEATPRSTARPAEPRWFWVALMGGSIALHLVAVALILPFVGRATIKSDAIEATPVDFVQLPSTPSPISAPAKTSPPPPAEKAAQPASLPSGISAVPTLPPARSPVQTPEPSVEPPAIEPPPSAPPENQSENQSPQPSAAQPAATPAITPPSPTLPSLPQTPPSPTPQPSPSAPLVSTVPIDQAVPDVSQVLPIPSADPSQLAPVQTSREAQPIKLVASLQAADIPPAQLETPPPDTIAQPTEIADGVSRYSFVADPKVSSCIPDAAAASAIGSGTQVPIQVSTDALGKVMEATLLQPSQNPSYDQLATCLVNNWSFQPAIAAGLPVPSKALVVLVTIDRG
jgi:TonB family protein